MLYFKIMFILTLERLMNCILSEKPLQVFDLSMSVDGFVSLANEPKISNQKMPQTYIHVCDQGALKNKVLRIGKAESGVYKRWVTAKNGHQNTFFWAIDETKNYYGQKNAQNYPNYLLFFALLNGLRTKLYVLSCQHGKDGQYAARSAERALIGHFSPLWEIYKVKFKNQSDFDPIELSKCGGALNQLKIRNESLVSYITTLGVNLEDIGDFDS